MRVNEWLFREAPHRVQGSTWQRGVGLLSRGLSGREKRSREEIHPQVNKAKSPLSVDLFAELH